MANLSKAVEQQKKSMRVLARAKNGRFVSVNPLKMLAELPAAPAVAPGTVESSERALLVAALIDNPTGVKANASGYAKSSYTKKKTGGYSYTAGYYGTFENNDNRVISYDELMGIEPTGGSQEEAAYVESQVALNSDASQQPSGQAADEPEAPANEPSNAPANEEKGLKAFWAKYKMYIIILLVIVLAVVAYKKL